MSPRRQRFGQIRRPRKGCRVGGIRADITVGGGSGVTSPPAGITSPPLRNTQAIGFHIFKMSFFSVEILKIFYVFPRPGQAAAAAMAMAHGHGIWPWPWEVFLWANRQTLLKELKAIATQVWWKLLIRLVLQTRRKMCVLATKQLRNGAQRCRRGYLGIKLRPGSFFEVRSS